MESVVSRAWDAGTLLFRGNFGSEKDEAACVADPLVRDVNIRGASSLSLAPEEMRPLQRAGYLLDAADPDSCTVVAVFRSEGHSGGKMKLEELRTAVGRGYRFETASLRLLEKVEYEHFASLEAMWKRCRGSDLSYVSYSEVLVVPRKPVGLYVTDESLTGQARTMAEAFGVVGYPVFLVAGGRLARLVDGQGGAPATARASA